MMPQFTATASLAVAQPYPRMGTTRPEDEAVYPQQLLSRRAAASNLAANLDLAARPDGGASCYCPCCIISGGILWCC
jgi:hypothetical protein